LIHKSTSLIFSKYTKQRVRCNIAFVLFLLFCRDARG